MLGAIELVPLFTVQLLHQLLILGGAAARHQPLQPPENPSQLTFQRHMIIHHQLRERLPAALTEQLRGYSLTLKYRASAIASGNVANAAIAVAALAQFTPTASPSTPYSTGEIAPEPIVPV